jgi:hypothetical protein
MAWYQEEASGVRRQLWWVFLARRKGRQELRGDACGVDGCFVPAKTGGPASADQAEQGLNVDGAGQWRGDAVGSIPGGGIPCGRHPPRAALRHGRYRWRWIVERTFACLGHFRRLVAHDERLTTTYAGFFHLACALLTLRRRVNPDL